MKNKLRELALKYEIPLDLIEKAIDCEKEKVILQNRRMAPILERMIGEYCNPSEDGDLNA